MLDKVPTLSESCIGIGTVVVVAPIFRCIIRWLPRWRTETNPFCSSIRHTSEPDRTRSLPNRNLNLRYKDFAVKSTGNLGFVGRLEKQRQRFDEVCARLFNRRALAGDIEFRT